MARQTGANTFAGNLEVLAGAPLDARSVVPTKADLTVSENFPYSYVGMMVIVKEEGKAYILNNEDFTIASNWKEVGTGSSEGSGGEPIDLSDYYTKSETYSKNEVDGLIDAIPSGSGDPVDAYTKAETDELLNAKADSSNVYGKEDVYTKDEIDDIIDGIDSGSGSGEVDLSDYYTKDNVDTALSGKADVSTTYTKSEVDGLLDDKANTSDVYAKTDTYSKTEVDDLIDAIPSGDAYTKAETDALLNDKADASTTYSKSEVDTALGDKADVSTTYTKTEVDELIQAVETGEINLTDYYTKTETEEYVQGELSTMASEFSDTIDEALSEGLENKLEESDLPNIIDTLDDIFEGITLPENTSTLPNAGVLTGFNTDNGQLTYNGQAIEFEEDVDTDSVINSILNNLNADTIEFSTMESLPYALNTPWKTGITPMATDLTGIVNISPPYEDVQILEFHVVNYPELDLVPYTNDNGKIKVEFEDGEFLTLTAYDSDYLNDMNTKDTYIIKLRCKAQ